MTADRSSVRGLVALRKSSFGTPKLLVLVRRISWTVPQDVFSGTFV